MDDQPTPTEEEQERTPEDLPEAQAMQAGRDEDPKLPRDEPARRPDPRQSSTVRRPMPGGGAAA